MVPLNGPAGMLAALLFLSAAMTGLDVFSAVTSSPWTARNFGADKDKADSFRTYIKHAVVITLVLVIASALLAKSIWPVAGALIATAYMYWLYSDALKEGEAKGSTGWTAQ